MGFLCKQVAGDKFADRGSKRGWQFPFDPVQEIITNN
jgi:hypothetical protein